VTEKQPQERIALAAESIASSMNCFLIFGYGVWFVFLIRSCGH
jgi:hypothetical protein